MPAWRRNSGQNLHVVSLYVLSLNFMNTENTVIDDSSSASVISTVRAYIHLCIERMYTAE